MNRKLFLVVHRYTGLLIALFLIVAGSTGVALAFYDELDHTLNPHLFYVEEKGQVLPLDEIVRQVEQSDLQGLGRVSYIRFASSPDRSLQMIVTPDIDKATGEPHNLPFNWLYVNPYSGEVLGTRLAGAWRFDRIHLMPLLMNLHHTLTLPNPWGRWVFGAAALLWVLDCFVGFYLTLPRRRRAFFDKWKNAWSIRGWAGTARLTRDLHIAISLWLWGFLLIFACSSVMFNLTREVYYPVLSALVPYERVRDSLPAPEQDGATPPALSFDKAHLRARELMTQWQNEQGFQIYNEDSLSFDSAKLAWRYRVKSSLDLPDSYSQTRLYFSATDGQLLAREHAYLDTGNAITTWLIALHMGRVFGTWYQVLVALVGVAVTAVTITGVLIWWRKRHVGATSSQTFSSPARSGQNRIIPSNQLM